MRRDGYTAKTKAASCCGTTAAPSAIEAMNLVYPDGLEVVVLTNATTADPENIALQVARSLY